MYLVNNKYKKNNITKAWINKFNFYKITIDDEEAYRYTFPVFKYYNSPILDCEITIFTSDGEVKINVYDHGTKSRYAPFYYIEYGNYDKVIKKINKEINKKLKEFGIEKVNEHDKYIGV